MDFQNSIGTQKVGHNKIKEETPPPPVPASGKANPPPKQWRALREPTLNVAPGRVLVQRNQRSRILGTDPEGMLCHILVQERHSASLSCLWRTKAGAIFPLCYGCGSKSRSPDLGNPSWVQKPGLEEACHKTQRVPKRPGEIQVQKMFYPGEYGSLRPQRSWLPLPSFESGGSQDQMG